MIINTISNTSSTIINKSCYCFLYLQGLGWPRKSFLPLRWRGPHVGSLPTAPASKYTHAHTRVSKHEEIKKKKKVTKLRMLWFLPPTEQQNLCRFKNRKAFDTHDVGSNPNKTKQTKYLLVIGIFLHVLQQCAHIYTALHPEVNRDMKIIVK